MTYKYDESYNKHGTVSPAKELVFEASKLLKELEIEAERKIVDAIRFPNNSVGMVIHTQANPVTCNIDMKAYFTINQKKLDVSYSHECKSYRFDEKTKIDALKGLFEKVSQVVTYELMLTATKEGYIK